MWLKMSEMVSGIKNTSHARKCKSIGRMLKPLVFSHNKSPKKFETPAYTGSNPVASISRSHA